MVLHAVEIVNPEAVAFDCRFLTEFAALNDTSLETTLGCCLGEEGARAAEVAPRYGELLGEVLIDRTSANGLRVRSLTSPPPMALTLFRLYSHHWNCATNASGLARALPHWAACAGLDYLAGALLWAYGCAAW